MTAPAPRLPALRLAAALLGLQALAAVIFGVIEIGQIQPARPVVGVGVALIMLGYGALLAAVALAVVRGRRWSRGLAVVSQLLLLLLGWSFRRPPTTWVGFTFAAVALVVLVCLLLPGSTRAFVGEDSSG